MTLAWLRRKKLEARLAAVEIVNALSEAMGGGTAEGKPMGADGLLRSMGVDL